MKTAFLLFFLILIYSTIARGQGDAPPFIQGQSQATKAVATVIKAPNSQTTKLSSSQALLETGNKNLLANPSFEHQTYSTGWTNVGGTSAVETTIVIDGAKSFKSTQAATFVSFAPSDVTAYQAQFADGSVSALASISVKAGFSVKICARKAGVTTSQCSNGSRGDSKWETIQIAFPLGATSNGFEVLSDSAVTGDIYFDDAYFGFNPNFSALVNLSNVTEWTSYTPTGTWSTNTTYQGKWRRVGDTMEIEFGITLSGAPTATALSVNIPTGYLIDTSKKVTGNIITVGGVGQGHNAGSGYVLHLYYANTTSVAVSYQSSNTALESNVAHNAPVTWVSGNTINAKFAVPIVGWTASSSTIVTTNDTFSTDTAALFHKATACLSTEIGCFNTYSYAINTNTKTICATAPTQTIASMNTNGIQIFTRAYNAASTCGNPARVEVMVGPKYKASTPTSLYKTVGKLVGMEKGKVLQGTTTELGFTFNSYEETTGFLILDAGLNYNATTTSSQFLPTDSSGGVNNGYLVVNNSKNPAMSGIDVGFVAARCINTSGQSIANTGYTKMSCTTETKDTHSALASSGTFTAPVKGNYTACAGYIFDTSIYAATNTILGVLSKNNTAHSYIDYHQAYEASTFIKGASGCDDLELNVGDTVHFELANTRTAGATLLNVTPGTNFFTIKKNTIGN